MGIQERSVEKIDIDRGAELPPLYASLYRFGEAHGPAPVIVYVGGAQTLHDYLERRTTPPEPIVAMLRRALREHPLPSLDALICPCPLGLGADGFDGFVDHFDSHLVPRLGFAPRVLGCVGHSAGAALAVHLAILRRARAAAVFGSTGVAERVHELRRFIETEADAGWTGLPLVIMRNASDNTVNPFDLAKQLPRPIQPVPRKALPGTHAFRDYAANETAAGAFLFVLKHLAD